MMQWIMIGSEVFGADQSTGEVSGTLTEWHPFWTSRKKAEPEN